MGKKIFKTESLLLGMKTKDIVGVTTQIQRGNYLSFLDLETTNYYETIAMYGMLISKIEPFELYLKYLNRYLDLMNCWAHCDLLTFPHLQEQRDVYLMLSKKYATDKRTYVRRLSLFILFKLLKTEEDISHILLHLLKFEREEEYYVIMMAGWLLSECIIVQEKQTIQFLRKYTLNKKIVNKGIQKCRESNRLSKDKKDWLLQFKMK